MTGLNASTRHIVVERVPAELVVGTRAAFKERLLEHLAAGADVIIDFHKTGYLDSSGLGALCSVRRSFRLAGRELLVCGLNDDLKTLFELTKLDSMFAAYADVAAARAAIVAIAFT